MKNIQSNTTNIATQVLPVAGKPELPTANIKPAINSKITDPSSSYRGDRYPIPGFNSRLRGE